MYRGRMAMGSTVRRTQGLANRRGPPSTTCPAPRPLRTRNETQLQDEAQRRLKTRSHWRDLLDRGRLRPRLLERCTRALR